MNLITRPHTPLQKKSPTPFFKKKTIKPCFREAHLLNTKGPTWKSPDFILYPSQDINTLYLLQQQLCTCHAKRPSLPLEHNKP